MRLYVNVKQAGKRKNHITREEIHLEPRPETLRELIGMIVRRNVEDYNNRIQERTILDFLTDDEISESAGNGKVSFGELYNENEAKLDKALECAFLAYEDGIYRVLVGDTEAGKLDDRICLEEDDVLTLIRLTLLTGKIW